MCAFLQLWCSHPSFRGEAAFLFLGAAHRFPPCRGEDHRDRERPRPTSARVGNEDPASHLPQFSERYLGFGFFSASYAVNLGIVLMLPISAVLCFLGFFLVW